MFSLSLEDEMPISSSRNWVENNLEKQQQQRISKQILIEENISVLIIKEPICSW